KVLEAPGSNNPANFCWPAVTSSQAEAGPATTVKVVRWTGVGEAEGDDCSSGIALAVLDGGNSAKLAEAEARTGGVGVTVTCVRNAGPVTVRVTSVRLPSRLTAWNWRVLAPAAKLTLSEKLPLGASKISCPFRVRVASGS